MSRTIDRNDPSSWSEEDVRYLAERGQLPMDELSDEERAEVAEMLSPEQRKLHETANTGDVNFDRLTTEQLEQELIRRKGSLGDLDENPNPPGRKNPALEEEDDEDDEDGDDEPEDYDEGWTNDDRRAELSRRGLSVAGNKDELIARLLRSDNDELTPEDQATPA